jgi:sirohydrochlorin ferrochelatase
MTARLLVDNGSTRPDSTRTLRRLAATLAERLGSPVQPVSLQHSDLVPADRLDGRRANTLEPFLERALTDGQRDFLVLPLYFGPSSALTGAIPRIVAGLAGRRGPVRLRIAPELCPLPAGEPLLADLLADQVLHTAAHQCIAPRRVVLVDHGSPLPQVSAVRTWLAHGLRQRLGDGATVQEAAMERRPGPEYDFNGEPLATLLGRLAQADPLTPVILSMLFLAPGRHAGPDGDIAEICRRVESGVPGFRVLRSPLVGEHPGLIEILARREAQAGTGVETSEIEE